MVVGWLRLKGGTTGLTRRLGSFMDCARAPAGRASSVTRARTTPGRREAVVFVPGMREAYPCAGAMVKGSASGKIGRGSRAMMVAWDDRSFPMKLRSTGLLLAGLFLLAEAGPLAAASAPP